jgi:hypothetical protein
MNDAASSRADEKHEEYQEEYQKVEERTSNRLTCNLFVAGGISSMLFRKIDRTFARMVG